LLEKTPAHFPKEICVVLDFRFQPKAGPPQAEKHARMTIREKNSMAFGVPGFSIGHYTDSDALTGCTVILCPSSTVGSCDIRGSSPATRETALLAPDKTMQEVHAVLLTGGSAFGLSAADGVMKYLQEHNIGYQTPWVKVPIVPAAAIFDLNIGDVSVRPTAESGYKACVSARGNNDEQGNVGAGTGATVGKWAGAEHRMRGGFGVSTVERERVTVGCVAVVNSVGDVVDAGGRVLAGARKPSGGFFGDTDPVRILARAAVSTQTNTTLVCLATNARLSKVQVHRLSQRAHDGMARAITPTHTSYDGDLVFALARQKNGGQASGNVDADFDLVAELGAEATAQAIRNAVKHAKSAGGVPGLA
jgi:L-aminopeptidase/D-esterase-like protein